MDQHLQSLNRNQRLKLAIYLSAKRWILKQEKDFGYADEIRKIVEILDYTIEDGSTFWRLKPTFRFFLNNE